MVTNSSRLIDELRAIVGSGDVLTDAVDTQRYRTGIRFGTGPALAVVRPATLLEQWKVLRACVSAEKIVIMQAANTGLTGGSTPDGSDYDREIVIVNTLRMNRIRLIRNGTQVVCYPGATLYQLEDALRPLGREPHSVIGSSCIGASVLGGICNNSGGALIHRGPAYTEMTLFARVKSNGDVQLVNHLGIHLGSDPETILRRLDAGDFTEADIEDSEGRVASDQGYGQRVREIDATTPARFNSDSKRLFETAGSAGKVMAFAVRLDTFPQSKDIKAFYIGTNDPAELTQIRRTILATFKNLPVQGEYLHRTAFDIAEKYGKDTFLTIHYFGTKWLPRLFAVKGRFDALAGRVACLPHDLSDRILQGLAKLMPKHLPRRMRQFRNSYEHHLMLMMASEGIEEARRLLKTMFPSNSGDFFECSDEERSKAFLHRFSAAGAAIRYRAIHRSEVEDIVALDIALRRNDRDWVEALPEHLSRQIIHKLYYGHFFCHVFHQDYIVAKGNDTLALEHQMWKILDARGAEYPAEHNVGHLYAAKPALVSHYQALDPCNCFNPGIGQTSRNNHWLPKASAMKAPF